MKQNFTLPEFSGAIFDFDLPFWASENKLYMNGQLLEQSKEKGRPYIIPTADGETIYAYQASNFPDAVPNLKINGVTHRVIEKLSLVQYVIGGFPLLLLLLCGMIGGVVGGLATTFNYKCFRTEFHPAVRWLLVILAGLGAYMLSFGLQKMFFQYVHPNL